VLRFGRAPAPAAPGEHEGVTGVTFQSGGNRLVGTLYLARGQAPKPTALLLHGCPGLEKNLDLAVSMRDRGWNAMVFHYRGCWGSGGRYDLRTIPGDVAAAVDYLESGEYPSVDPGRLAAVGHSLGGWAAVLAAAADQRLRAVAVYGAAVDLAGLDLTPEQVEREMTRFMAVTPEEFSRQRSDVSGRPGPLDLVASIAPRPLLIVHGRDDAWVPVEHARRLRSAAGRPCRYAEVDGANHSFAWHRATLRDLVTRWLDEVNSAHWEER
jgi:dipeptidyl aminopeptidase/acylaminoacyl peptidase